MVDRISTWRSNSHKRNVVIVLFGFHLCVSLLFGAMMTVSFSAIIFIYIMIGIIYVCYWYNSNREAYKEYIKKSDNSQIINLYAAIIFIVLSWPIFIIKIHSK
jgi:amino acid transporter